MLKATRTLPTDDAVKRMCAIARELQKQHDDKQSHGGLTPAHILFVPDADGAVELVAASRVKAKARFAAQYEGVTAEAAASTGGGR